jgi:hypothetical protein
MASCEALGANCFVASGLTMYVLFFFGMLPPVAADAALARWKSPKSSVP